MKTPPMIAHVLVRKWYVGIDFWLAMIEIGERSYLKSTAGACRSVKHT